MSLATVPARGQTVPPATQSAEAQHSLFYGVYLPSERSAARGLALAREMLREARYAETIPLVLRVLNADEDCFGAQQAASPSLRRQARRIIFDLPPEGLRAYLLEVQAASKREFQLAVQVGDTALADIAARYPRTEAGRAATWLLSQRALDYGLPEQAAAQLRELLNDPDLTAADRADIQRQLIWASESQRPPVPPWDARRNLVSHKPVPHFWASWVCPFPANPAWASLAGTAGLHAGPPAGAAYPLVVENWVLVRGAESLYAIDRKTGKLGWRADLATPQSPSRLLAGQQGHAGTRGLERSLIKQQLDAVNTRISSDGGRVFAIHAIAKPAPKNRTRLWAFRARNKVNRWGAGANEIVAIDVPSEGKLAWRTGTHPELKKVFFLDAPLSVSGRLYAVGEVEQTLFLYQLDTMTGAALWKQSLATVESPVEEESLRTACGAAICSADGLILCSTGVGMLIAVNPVNRSLEWVYRVQADEDQEAQKNSLRGRRRAYRATQDDSKRWLQNRILIQGGRVYLATPESQRLSCLALAGGQEEWSVRHGYPQLLCCANESVVVMAAEDSLLGLSPETGEPLWRMHWPALAAPSGAGALFGDHYLQPLSDGTTLVLDAQSGERVERFTVGPEGLMGNLTIVEDCVYSQSYAQVSRFDLAPRAGDRASHSAQTAATLGDSQSAARLWLKAYREAPNLASIEPLRESLLSTQKPAYLTEEQRTLLGELSTGRTTPRIIQIAELQDAVRKQDTARIIQAIREVCQSATDERLFVVSQDLAMSFCQHFRAAAQQSLTTAQINSLRAELLSGAGPAQRETTREILGIERRVAVASPPAPASKGVGWGSHQVTARLTPRQQPRATNNNRSNGETLEVEIPVDSDGEHAPYGALALFINSEGMLTGRNQYGEPILLVELPNGLFERLEKLVERREIVAYVRGERLFLPTGRDIISFRIAEGSPSGVWQAIQALKRADIDPGFAGRSRLRRGLISGLAGEMHLLAVSPHGVVVSSRDLLACLDPESGAVRWVHVEIKTGDRCAADERFAYSSPPTRPAWRVALGTGKLETVDAPSGRVLALQGGMLTLAQSLEGANNVVVYDRRGKQIVLTEELGDTFRHDLAGELLVFASESGAVLVLDAQSGHVLLKDQLSFDQAVESVTAERFGERLVLQVNHTEASEHEKRGVRSFDANPVGTGPVYCYDLESGKQLWQSPAMVSGMALLSRRPSGCPVLVFAANTRTQEGGNRRTELRVLVLDAATGQKLYLGKGPKRGRAQQYRIRFDDGPTPNVFITFDNCRVVLSSLEQPAPPNPPFTATVEETAGGGFWQMSAELGRWFQEGPTQKPSSTNPPGRASDDD